MKKINLLRATGFALAIALGLSVLGLALAGDRVQAPCACESMPHEVLYDVCGGAPDCVYGIDCPAGCYCGDFDWDPARATRWDTMGAGEYVGHARSPHVCEYRLRVDDQLEFVYVLTREETGNAYELNVGDEIRVESFADKELTRDLVVQPDGTVTLRLLGAVKVTHKTIEEVRDMLETAYTKYYKMPTITVTPLKVNTKLEDLRAAVDARAGAGGQTRQARITPDGTIALPVINSVPAQGLTLEELGREVNQRYSEQIIGIEVTPVLIARAPRYVYVVGEVHVPGRFTLEGPTTVMQAIAMAGSWNVVAHIKQVVVFRRGEDWRLKATMLDLDAALRGKTPCAADEIWLNDSDVVIVPKSPILATDDFIHLVFTRGIYGVLPIVTSYSFSGGSL